MSWFRFYVEALDDPKVQRLPDALFKAWVNFLCLAKKGGGTISGDLDDVAFQLRLPRPKVEAQVAALAKAGLLDRDGNGWKPHNWDGRQYESDNSATRVKRHRERQRNVTSTVTPAVTETPSETDTDSETEQTRPDSEKEAPAQVADQQTGTEIVPRGTLADEGDILPISLDRTAEGEAVRAWNAAAERLGLKAVQKLTQQRRVLLRARLADAGGLPGIAAALAKVEASPFLKGQNDRGWAATFDFFVTERGFTRIMEGQYDARPNGAAGGQDFDEIDRIIARNLGVAA